jgi:hypothetical protein
VLVALLLWLWSADKLVRDLAPQEVDASEQAYLSCLSRADADQQQCQAYLSAQTPVSFASAFNRPLWYAGAAAVAAIGLLAPLICLGAIICRKRAA